MDGKCAGAIVKHRYPETKMFPMDYKDTIPDEILQARNAEIWIVDFSFPIVVMEALQKHNLVIWCDHHASAIEEMRNYKFLGNQNVDAAGCLLTWRYVHPLLHEVPRCVNLISDFDCHAWIKRPVETQEDILNFMAGCELGDYWPEEPIWAYLFEAFTPACNTIINEGSVVRRYVRRQTLRELSASAVMLNGWLVCNSHRPGDETHKEFVENRGLDVRGSLTWYRTRFGGFKVSLRSDDPLVDCSVIAKAHGGGGHHGAAGFVVNSLDEVMTICQG
jgi:oligoribonuclease NrnB/cAMP/cGMP phosphodiesterase (DHH superfamily)